MKTLANEHDRLELLRRLQAVAPDSRARWGRMTAHEMMCHLGDAFRMALGEKPVRCVDRLVSRTLVKWIALYTPLRWPPGIPTLREIDPQRDGTRPGDFAQDTAAVGALMERVAARQAFDGSPHPLFGTMSAAAWFRWGYVHTDHHLRQFGA